MDRVEEIKQRWRFPLPSSAPEAAHQAALDISNLVRGIEAYRNDGHWHVEDCHTEMWAPENCEVCAWLEREQREEQADGD